MSANGDWLDCDRCGRRINTLTDAFTEDADRDEDFHVDCDDPQALKQEV